MNSKEQAEKSLKIVEQQYTAFANSINWDFFRGLAQYTKTVQEMMPTKAIVEALEKQRELAIKPYMTLSKTSWEEMTKAGEEVIKIVKNINEKQNKYKIEMDETVLQISQQLAGLLSTKDPLNFFNNNLLDVATKIKSLGFGNTIRKYEDATKTNVYANYTFSPTYEKANYEKRTLERRQETEVWGAWIELPEIEKVVLEPEELNKQARKNLENTEGGKNIKKTKPHLFENFQTLPVQEMDLIRLGKKEAEKSFWFKTSKYKDYARRIHIYITTELIKSESDTKSESLETIKPLKQITKKEEKAKSGSTIKIENDFLVFGLEKIPVERGQKNMIELFIQNAKIYRKGRLTQKGTGTFVVELQKIGGYRDENAFRDGLKRLRTKIKKAEFPAIIENQPTKKYQLIIKYQ